MAIKKLEEFTPEEVEALEKEQYDTLVQDGQLDVPDVPAAVKEPEKEPPAPEGAKEPETEPPVKTPEEIVADFQKQLDEVRRSNAGLRETLARERRRREEGKVPGEPSELVKRILSLEDGDLLDAKTVKEGIQADQTREAEIKKLQAKRIEQVEESKEMAMGRYQDYEAVIKDGLPAYVASLPESRREIVLKTIAEGLDPAELAYTYGLRGMALVKKPEGKETKPKEPEDKETPVILRGGKTSTSPADKSLEELIFGGYTAEQLEKMARDAERERLKGG